MENQNNSIIEPNAEQISRLEEVITCQGFENLTRVLDIRPESLSENQRLAVSALITIAALDGAAQTLMHLVNESNKVFPLPFIPKQTIIDYSNDTSKVSQEIMGNFEYFLASELNERFNNGNDPTKS